jgi:tryptophan 2,3-dioxygenase
MTSLDDTVRADKDADDRLVTELGPVAESYDQLHRIDLLGEARAARGVPEGTYDSLTCAIFQASEVCLLNLARLATRTRACVVADDIPAASRYVQWDVGFHRLLRKLGTAMFEARGIFGSSAASETATISISESAGYASYVDTLRNLEDVVKASLLVGAPELTRSTIATKSIDDSLYRVLHGIRIGCHDATKWESDLTAVPNGVRRNADELISAETLARAVAATELNADTFHGEFVALHQVPEILCAESNDHLEAAIRWIRKSALSRAAQHLAACRTLLEPVVEAQRVMAEHLATGEYHGFRTNLGPASGTHSLAIKQHMFRDLFKHLWNDLEAWLRSLGAPSLEQAVRDIDERRHDDSAAWLRHTVVDQAFQLHSAYQQWRHEHLHMPRNCLGSGGTKSMIGVPDGPQAVSKMRDAANAQRSLVAIHRARRTSLSNAVPDSPLAKLIADPASVDSELMKVVGEATREYFPQVQEQSYQPFRSGAAERNP